MLRVSLDLFLVGVHKGLWVTRAAAKKGLELVLYNRDRAFSISFLLIQLPAEADPVPEEGRGKETLGRPHSSTGSKVVLILLTEIVAVHVGIFVVYVQETGLQLLSGHLKDNWSWGGSGRGSGSLSLQTGFKNLLQVILGVLGNTSSSGKGVSKGFCL